MKRSRPILAFLILSLVPLALHASVTAPVTINDDLLLGSEDWGSAVFAMNNNSGTNTIDFQLTSGAQTLTLGSVGGGLASITLTGSAIFTYLSGAQPVVNAIDSTTVNPFFSPTSGMSVTLSETHSLQLENSGLQLTLLGGNGGGVTIDNNGYTDSASGASGGDASVSVAGTLSMGTDSALTLTGGTGGAVSLFADGNNGITCVSSVNVLGGTGGNSAVTAGTMTLSTASLSLTGGTGGAVSIGAVNTANGIVNLTAGNDVGVSGGNGGNALVTTGPVSFSSSNFSLTGGTGGSVSIEADSGANGIYSFGPMTVTGGTGGNASVTASSVTLAASNLTVSGGTGGNLNINTNGGIGTAGFSSVSITGGDGGNAGVSLGTLVLDNSSTLSVQGGTGGQSSLSVGTFSPAGSAYATVGSLNGSGTVTMSGLNPVLQVASGNFSGLISGNESLLVSGGALTLTGANNYTGGTTVSAASTLQIQNNGNVGNNGLALDGGTLQSRGTGLNLSENVTLTSNGGAFDCKGGNSFLTGLISGSGGLTVTNSIGAGGVELSGANSYTGGTALNAGLLMTDNLSALGAGNVAVNGGTLALVAPLSIVGNYTQNSGGTLDLSLGAGTVNPLNIAGAATLDGTLALNPIGNFQFHIHDTETIDLLNAGSVTGTYGTFTDNIPGDPATLVYDSASVLLEVTGPSFASLALTYNQKQVAGVLDGLVGTAGTTTLFAYLNSQTDSALPGYYDQISPANLTPMFHMEFSLAEAEAGMIGGRLANLLNENRSNDLAWNGEGPRFAGNLPASQEAGMAKNLTPERWGVFASGLGDFGTVTSDGNGPGYQYSTGGMVAGMDYRFSKEFAGGLMLGYSSSGNSQSTASVNATGGQLGLYGGLEEEGFHMNALAEAGINNYTTQRPTVGGTASGSTQGWLVSEELGLGYDFNVDEAEVGPYLSEQYSSASIDHFVETGSLAPLTYNPQSGNSMNSDLGVSASRAWDLGGGAVLTPSLSAAWEHLFQGNEDSLTARIGAGGNFTVNGPVMGTDAAVIAAGLNAQLDKGFNVYASYQGKIGQTNYTEGNVSGGVNFGF